MFCSCVAVCCSYWELDVRIEFALCATSGVECCR
jgi:hypothetical protein